MKDRLLKEIEKALSEYELLTLFFTKEQQSFDVADKVKKIKIGSAITKRNDCVLKVIHYTSLLKDIFNEEFPISENIKKEVEDYLTNINSISISKNGDITYSKEFENLFTQLESQFIKNNGN